MERVVKTGSGWRLGWNPQATGYQGLVGGEDWAIELTEAELEDFCRLLGQLAQTMSQMADELMEDKKIRPPSLVEVIALPASIWLSSFSGVSGSSNGNVLASSKSPSELVL